MSSDSPIGFDRRSLPRATLPERRTGPVLDDRGYWWPERDQVAVQVMARYGVFAVGEPVSEWTSS